MENKIRISTFDNGLIIKISGELDSYKTLAYKTKIRKEMERYQPLYLIFDFKNLQFLDSAGIGLVLGRYNEVKNYGGEVGVIGLSSYAEKIVKISGLSSVIGIYKSLAQFKKEVDSYKTLAYKTKIRKEMERYQPLYLIFDFKNLQFLDSAGIGLVLGRYNEVKNYGGEVGVIGLSSYAEKIVKISGLSSVIGIYKSLAQFKKEVEVKNG